MTSSDVHILAVCEVLVPALAKMWLEGDGRMHIFDSKCETLLVCICHCSLFSMKYMPISTVLFVSGSLSRDCSDKVDYQCCIMAGELYSVAMCHNL